jgi:hypothetical protein
MKDEDGLLTFMIEIEDLRRHFEQDKKKLQELKASRLFQPL